MSLIGPGISTKSRSGSADQAPPNSTRHAEQTAGQSDAEQGECRVARRDGRGDRAADGMADQHDAGEALRRRRPRGRREVLAYLCMAQDVDSAASNRGAPAIARPVDRDQWNAEALGGVEQRLTGNVDRHTLPFGSVTAVRSPAEL